MAGRSGKRWTAYVERPGGSAAAGAVCAIQSNGGTVHRILSDESDMREYLVKTACPPVQFRRAGVALAWRCGLLGRAGSPSIRLFGRIVSAGLQCRVLALVAEVPGGAPARGSR